MKALDFIVLVAIAIASSLFIGWPIMRSFSQEAMLEAPFIVCLAAGFPTVAIGLVVYFKVYKRFVK